MHKRTRTSLLVTLLAVCALAAAFFLFQKTPPEVARLLPESDAVVFVDLSPIRTATHFDRSSVARSPSYQQFIDATGIVAERDLERAAFAMHRMPDPSGPNGSVAFSEVFVGHFDAERLERYLQTLATNQETYAGHTIYAIPSEARTFRVTILSDDTIAASNMPTPEQIHAILDRHRGIANPFAENSLLSALFNEVPAFSVAWGVGDLGLPFAEGGQIQALGVALPLRANTEFVASLRFSPALHLRIDQLAANQAEAVQTAQSLTSLLTLFRTLERGAQARPPSPGEAAVRQLFDSAVIEPRREHGQERATLTATVPAESLLHLARQ